MDPQFPRIRPVRDEDSDALIALVGGVYAEYPGCVLDLPGVDADLVAPRSTMDAKGGELWLAEDPHGHLLGCCGWAPSATADDTVELKRLYVRVDARGTGLGTAFVRRVEQVAKDRGARRVELWSDSRFGAAHRLYDRLGYTATGASRELHDPSDTTEYQFVKQLS